MEIKINIPQNNYVRPTEVREDVVQMICDSLLHYQLDHESAHDVEFSHEDPMLALRIYGYKRPVLEGGHRRTLLHPEVDIVVRSCEMKAAFTALQDAGYYIYPYRHNGHYSFHLCSRPVYCERMLERVEFNLFID